MGINKLRHFTLVYELGSMRKAAEVLKMSPGSLSKSIKTLEDEIGHPLFLPSGRNIQASEVAKKIYSQSRTLVLDYDHLISALKNEVNSPTPLRIATWEVFSSYLIPRSIASAKTPLLILERPPEALEKTILNHEADIGITHIPVPHLELEYLKISTFRFGVFTRNDLFSNSTLKELPFAVPVTKIEGSLTGIRTLDSWPSHTPRKIQFQFELLESALEACRLGKCAIYAPNFLISLQNELYQKKYHLLELKQFQFLSKKPQSVFLVKRRGEKEHPETSKLIKRLKEVLSKTP